MKNTDKDKVIIKEALNDIREERVRLEREVAEARAESRDANQKLQVAEQKLEVASDELKDCYTQIATLKSMKEEMERNEVDLTTVESQCSGEMPALYDEGFAACYW